MHLRASLTKFWAYSSMLLVTGIILFLFGYVFYRGAGTISWEFLSQPPRGAVLGEEGGIWPAIVGSLCFTATAIVLGGIPAVATALFMVFYCKGRRTAGLIRMVIQCISGIPSIVLGLFAYSFLVDVYKRQRVSQAAGLYEDRGGRGLSCHRYIRENWNQLGTQRRRGQRTFYGKLPGSGRH